MKAFLQARLRRVIRRQQWRRLAREFAVCWLIAAAVGMGLIFFPQQTGWASPYTFPLLVVLAGSAACTLAIRNGRRRPDERAIAAVIEAAYPELRGLLLTAVQQLDSDETGVGSYLRYRVLQQAVEHCQETNNWSGAVPALRVRGMMVAQLAALALLVVTLWQGRALWTKGGTMGGSLFATRGLTVTPGDVTLERGETLVVLARFGGALPPGVNLVVSAAASPARTVPLVKSLADPIFGGSVPDMTTDFTYRIDYNGERTREFMVKVYEHPRLVRADAELTYPDYTALPPRRIEDTRRVSAVEGTKLGLALQLNKPVRSAVLVARTKEKTQIPLTVTAGKAVAALTAFPLSASQSYDLKLTDADGRVNKPAAPLVIDVLPNRRPELKLVAPRGDVRPSALEEVAFEGTVWDDFGVPAYGLAYTVAGKETKFIELGRGVAAKEKRTFGQLVRLEELGVKPFDLVSWYAWADDIGPDAKVRRTTTDMFFAEVRPFEESFKESQEMQGEEQDGQGQQGAQTRKLTELQKQIISATWKLQRTATSPQFSSDVGVVSQSQAQALQQAEADAAKGAGPRSQTLWGAVTKSMADAKTELERAASSPTALAAALTAEQAAYQSLLRLQARETSVTRSRSRSRGQGGGDQANQQQIDGLDLNQSENRYETQRQAKAPQSPERREQNQVLNRLQELARRQQDVNERLKELQTALQAARTEPEKEDVRRQLKRLQDEQKQMVADMDEVRQRMARPENQSAMQEQREQLDRTRDEVQKAADAIGEGAVSQALAAGTRAGRELQQMRDELRKQSSSDFSEDLKQMRSEARDLARQQEEVTKKIAGLDESKKKSLDDTPERKAVLDQLEQQQKRMSDLVERATQVSQQAETTEPLLSRQLYDSVRKIAQDEEKIVKDARQRLLEEGMLTRSLNERLQKSAQREGGGKSLELTTELLKQGYLPQAGKANQQATAGVEELKRGVERAVENVLGDDAEALKLAQSELEKVTDQLTREMKQGQAGAEVGEAVKAGQPQAPGTGEAGEQRQAGTDPATPGAETPEGKNPGQSPGSGRGDPANRGRAQQQLAGGSANIGGAEDGRAPGRVRLDDLLNRGGELQRGAGGGGNGGPLMGDDFGGWADRLRDVEELVDQPALRDAVANARERARLVRQDFKRDQKKPDWAVVRLQILKPLIEVRARLSEELARRGSRDALVPIDRDPVPAKYSESVRRYYEELGKDN
jgi:hypothetical protein